MARPPARPRPRPPHTRSRPTHARAPRPCASVQGPPLLSRAAVSLRRSSLAPPSLSAPLLPRFSFSRHLSLTSPSFAPSRPRAVSHGACAAGRASRPTASRSAPPPSAAPPPTRLLPLTSPPPLPCSHARRPGWPAGRGGKSGVCCGVWDRDRPRVSMRRAVHETRVSPRRCLGLGAPRRADPHPPSARLAGPCRRSRSP